MSYEIINQDCIKAMQEMTDGCIDAIVTDPPYGLAFMGANWDHNVPSVSYWSECLRVAKSGAHLLCFGGTRTFHRLMCAIEDAGWEIRDTIMWVYGCLDEETEILVDGEFVPYNKAKIGSLALGYDIERGTFSWQRIEDTYLYDYDDTAYAIQSDSTDQLVSRNHRCIVERGGVEQFALAEQVAQERQACVPVLEGMQGLLDHLPLPDEGTSITQQDVLEGMRNEGRESGTEEAQGAQAEHDVSSMRGRLLHTDGMEAEGTDKLLLEELQGQGGERTKATGVQQGTPNANVRGAEASPQRANDGATESSMEGRGYIPSQPRELQGREIRQMPQGVLGDGTQGRVRDGAQACGGSGDRKAADKAGVRASRQPRPAGQQARESNVVPVECGSQDLRELWGAKSTLARVTPTHYKGKMWCVKVRTGAFVARRHGKIFVTGNSGFPKSLDVGKAIDKALGAERKVIGEHPNPAGNKAGGNSLNMSVVGMPEKAYITEPATDQAKEWDGWGTCLKPAWEPIIVARKPLDGTVAHNVMTYGTGAINIDGCRVGLDGGTRAVNFHGETGNVYGNGSHPKNDIQSIRKGRFPANLVHDGSQEVLELFPDTGKSTKSRQYRTPTKGNAYGLWKGDPKESPLVGYEDGGTAARFFYCAKESKRDRGEGNDHPTVKPNALMRWLVRLVCPQGGTVLDPFMGSGSTGVACIQEGMRFVGIDMDEHYCEIAEKRIGAEPDTVFAENFSVIG